MIFCMLIYSVFLKEIARVIKDTFIRKILISVSWEKFLIYQDKQYLQNLRI